MLYVAQCTVLDGQYRVRDLEIAATKRELLLGHRSWRPFVDGVPDAGDEGREYAKTGKIDPRYHRMLLDSFEWRQKSDYDVYWLATED
jgi:hypothetical protein